MRKFYFRKKSGGQVWLNNESGIFMTNVSGLGAAYTPSYGESSGHYSMIQRKKTQGQVVADIVFTSDPYTKYASFADLLYEEGLELCYAPNGTYYFAECSIKSLGKTELSSGVLSCPITIDLLSPWTQRTAISGSAGSNITVTATGKEPAAFELIITGVSSPTIQLSDSGGAIIGSARYSGSQSASSGLFFSTVPNHCAATIDGNDVVNSMNLATNGFFRIPTGETATLTSDGAVSGYVFNYWRTV